MSVCQIEPISVSLPPICRLTCVSSLVQCVAVMPSPVLLVGVECCV